MQAKSVNSSDKTTNGKRAKGEDFTEHKNILEQALAHNPCDERRVAMTGKTGFALGGVAGIGALKNLGIAKIGLTPAPQSCKDSTRDNLQQSS